MCILPSNFNLPWFLGREPGTIAPYRMTYSVYMHMVCTCLWTVDSTVYL